MLAIFILSILVIYLIQDFQKDKGMHRKAKAVQAICLSLLVLMNANIFKFIPSLLMNFGVYKARFTVGLGILPGWLHFTITLLDWTLMALVVSLALRMAKRMDKARKSFLYVAPIFGLTSSIGFFRAATADGDTLPFSNTAMYLIGLVLVGLAVAALMVIYSSQFMKAFYGAAPVQVLSGSNDVLDAGIFQDGPENIELDGAKPVE